MDDQRYQQLAEQHANRFEERAAECLTMANQIRTEAGLIQPDDEIEK